MLDDEDILDEPSIGDLKNVKPHLLAVTMLMLVFEGEKPWRMVDVSAMSEVNSKFPMACEFYQLRIFLDLLKQRFGRGVSGLVEASLVSVLDSRCEDAGVKLFHKFMVVVSNARETGFSEDDPDDIKIKVDFQVADRALKIVEASEEVKRTLRPSLAASLTYARIWAEKTYPSMVAQIEFNPESTALIEVETAYNGLTNRWRQDPGCFERHLQRMEGNPLFRESDRNPSDEDIVRARAKDDADLDQLRLDFELLSVNLERMGNPAQARDLIDVMRHRIEPLMKRAASLGKRPQSQLYQGNLRKILEASIKCMPANPGQGWDSFRKTWARETNVFYAQCFRDDTPIADRVLALLCESVEDIRAVLEIYRDWDIGLFLSMRKVARLRLEIAQLDGIALPGMAEKLALFSEESEGGPRHNESKPRPWWRVWS